MTVTERVVWRPVLGVAFSDAVTGVAVRDGLRVSARLGGRTRALVRSRDGAGWSLHSDREPPAGEVALHIEDDQARYLPAVVSLAAGFATFTLAAAAARSVPVGFGQVRATVQDRATRRPLPGVRLDVTVAGVTRSGHADGRGEVLVCLPWPKTAPAVAGTLPPADRTWSVAVKAAVPAQPPPAGADFALDLAAAYSPRKIAAKTGGGAALPHQTLRYGTALVLTTEGETALLLV